VTKTIVIDLDDTITDHQADLPYEDQIPNASVVKRLAEYRDQGFKIAIHTARNMRTYQGNVGLINANTLPIILSWLDRHKVPYDEVFVGKPWCGDGGFYVDDKAIRPDEFVNLNHEEIQNLIGNTVAV
jgi:capsule biosynthesis phosphatase